MFTAYTPPGNPHAQQMPQGYPLPPGYAPQQSARWQNYPPQNYPPPAGWQAGLTYTGKSGQSNTKNIVIYSVVLGVISLGVALFFIRR